MFDSQTKLGNENWLYKHCLDVAEKFISVPCTFDDSGMACGYATTELGEWTWSRKTGKDNNPLTGPESDAHGNLFGWS